MYPAIAAEPDFTDAQIELSADINSIYTDNDMRDNHLKTAEYFDAAKFPTLNFKSTSIKKTSNNIYLVSGQLTIHVVTKPAVLKAKPNGVGENPMSKKTTEGFKISGTIKHSDFGVGEPSAMLGDEVTLTSNIEIIKG